MLSFKLNILILLSIVYFHLSVCKRWNLRCPDNTVDRQTFLSYGATGETFLHLYSIEKSIEAFGKSYTSFTQNGDGTIAMSVHTYNEGKGECDVFDYPNIAMVERREKRRRSCCKRHGRPPIDCFITLEDSDASFRLFSQDPSRYFWMFGCFNGTVHSFDTCINGFVDLLTRDIRPGLTGEINLSGLPWYKILEDIEFTGIKIDDPKVKYIWIGPGCSF